MKFKVGDKVKFKSPDFQPYGSSVDNNKLFEKYPVFNKVGTYIISGYFGGIYPIINGISLDEDRVELLEGAK